MQFTRGTHAYLGLKDGLAVAVVFDDPGYEKDTAKHVSQWIKQGRQIVRVEAKEACERLRVDWKKYRERGEPEGGEAA